MSLFERIALLEFERKPMEPAPGTPGFLQAGKRRVGQSPKQKQLQRGGLASRPFPPIKREELPQYWEFMSKEQKRNWLNQQAVHDSVKKLGTVESTLYTRIFLTESVMGRMRFGNRRGRHRRRKWR